MIRYTLFVFRFATLRQLGLRLAIMACALMVVFPTLIRAQQAQQWQDPVWLALNEVCSAHSGSKGRSGDGQAAADTLLDECRYCQLGAGLESPPEQVPLVLSTAAATNVPALFLHAPYTLHAWALPATRGPPSAL